MRHRGATMSIEQAEAGDSSLSRRQALGSVAATLASPLFVEVADAIGPVSMDLSDITYAAVECPPQLKAGRVGGAFGGSASKGVLQQCLEVTATAYNPGKKPLVDAAVFGFVLNKEDGSSVIANNPDLRSDAGQFASIDEVPPGEKQIKFIFVATTPAADKFPPLDFKSVKAISYPGGARFAELSPCELDSLSPECDEVSDEDRQALKEKKMRY